MKTEKELKQIAKDLHNNKIFCDRQIRNRFELPVIFLPLTTITLKQRNAKRSEKWYFAYEYMDKSINKTYKGQPIFNSVQYLNKAESEIMFIHYAKLNNPKEDF